MVHVIKERLNLFILTRALWHCLCVYYLTVLWCWGGGGICFSFKVGMCLVEAGSLLAQFASSVNIK